MNSKFTLEQRIKILEEKLCNENIIDTIKAKFGRDKNSDSDKASSVKSEVIKLLEGSISSLQLSLENKIDATNIKWSSSMVDGEKELFNVIESHGDLIVNARGQSSLQLKKLKEDYIKLSYSVSNIDSVKSAKSAKVDYVLTVGGKNRLEKDIEGTAAVKQLVDTKFTAKLADSLSKLYSEVYKPYLGRDN